MDEIRALLESFGLDFENPDYSTLSDEQLAELQGGLFALFDELRDDENVDVEVLEALTLGGEAIRAEDEARQERVEELVASLGRSRANVRRTPLTLTAAAVTPRTVSLAQLAAAGRRPANTPVAEQSGAPLFVAQVGERVGQVLTALEAAALLRDTAQSHLPFRGSEGRRFSIVRARTDYADGQQLGLDSAVNEQRIRSMVASLQATPDRLDALAAAGGLCAPLSVRWDQDVEGDDSRPVRDALAPFDASRGGVRFVPGPTLADVDLAGSDAAVGVWTMEMDEAAINDSGTRKPVQRIVCADEQTVEVEAITKRLRVGNVLARTNPERVAAYIHLVMVAHARLAEQRLLARIKAGSTQTMEDLQVLGSFRDLAAVWIKAAWGLRNRHRIRQDVPLRLIVPDAVVPHSQIDLLRQMPGANHAEIVGDEFVRSQFAEAGIRLTLSPDMPAHLAPAQAAGAQVVDLPSPIEWSLQVEGTWAFLDGGTLDLGFEAATPIRDADLNAANDFELFGETFERAVKFGGVESIWGRTVVCPTGEVAGTVDVTCDTAS